MAEVLKTLFKGPLKYDFTDQLLYKVPENKSVIIKDVLTKRFNNLQEYEFQINGIRVDDLNNRVLNSGDELTCSFHNRDFLYFKEKNDNKGFEKYRLKENILELVDNNINILSGNSTGMKSLFDLSNPFIYYDNKILFKNSIENHKHITYSDFDGSRSYNFLIHEDEFMENILKVSNNYSKSKAILQDIEGNYFWLYEQNTRNGNRYIYYLFKIKKFEEKNDGYIHVHFENKDSILNNISNHNTHRWLPNGVLTDGTFYPFDDIKNKIENLDIPLYLHNLGLNKNILFLKRNSNQTSLYYLNKDEKKKYDLSLPGVFPRNDSQSSTTFKNSLGGNKKYSIFDLRAITYNMSSGLEIGNSVNIINDDLLGKGLIGSKKANDGTLNEITEYFRFLFDLETREIKKIFIKDLKTLVNISNKGSSSDFNNYFNPFLLGFNVENSLVEVKGVEFS